MDHDTLDSLCNVVSEGAWERRKAFVGFSAQDEAILPSAIHPIPSKGTATEILHQPHRGGIRRRIPGTSHPSRSNSQAHRTIPRVVHGRIQHLSRVDPAENLESVRVRPR